jgi:hypothetical protein
MELVAMANESRASSMRAGLLTKQKNDDSMFMYAYFRLLQDMFVIISHR